MEPDSSPTNRRLGPATVYRLAAPSYQSHESASRMCCYQENCRRREMKALLD